MDQNCKLSVLKWGNMVIHWLSTVLVESLRQEVHLFVISFQQDQSSKTRRRGSHRRHTGSLQGYSWSCDYREHHFSFRQTSLLWARPIAIHGRGALCTVPTLQSSEISTHDTDIQSHLVPFLSHEPQFPPTPFLLYPKCLLPHPYLPFCWIVSTQ